jgi:hypothetical protein
MFQGSPREPGSERVDKSHFQGGIELASGPKVAQELAPSLHS